MKWNGSLKIYRWAAISMALAAALACGKADDIHVDLHQACKDGDIAVVKKILARKGADVNARGIQFGERPLHWAAGQGHLEIVDFLLDHGADINATDKDGIVPLQVAVGKNQIAIVRRLVERKANLNHKCSDGSTPLYGAVYKDYLEIARLLIEAGADVNATTNNGVAAMDRAMVMKNKEMTQLLWQSGARPQKGKAMQKPTGETSGTATTAATSVAPPLRMK
ncbi:MAG: ankyrin repeat domain-containing protein [Candidatus Sumerlaeota bacterium]|nr:ankyrin repeat domain-containing protein [Candidatus Sumerlaeota bacterium]